MAKPADDTQQGLPVYLAGEDARVTRELEEIRVLLTEIKTESARQNQKYDSMDERYKTHKRNPEARLSDVVNVVDGMLKLTRQRDLMVSQIEVLAAKEKTLARLHDIIVYAQRFAGELPVDPITVGALEEGRMDELSRAVLSAQEETRRELAKAVHDGPAQSFSGLILQANIVERHLGRGDDPAAKEELGRLVGSIRSSLELTKGFIFQVRPMVLDDLGLVPTLRRSTADRARHSGVPVSFESLGPDRRMPDDIESGFFRLVDEAVQGLITMKPQSIDLTLDWDEDALIARFAVTRPPIDPNEGADLPPALAAMIAEQPTAVDRARSAGVPGGVMPAAVWQQIQQRMRMVNASLGTRDEGNIIEAMIHFAD
jgi:two-component system sensor histidine kinase DegS